LKKDACRLTPEELGKKFDLIQARGVPTFVSFARLKKLIGVVSANLQEGGFFATSFVAEPRAEFDMLTDVHGKGTYPTYPLRDNKYSHHFSEVFHVLRESGLEVTDAFRHYRGDVGLVARKTAQAAPAHN
jgi:predicted TPR repeat methyltransferase